MKPLQEIENQQPDDAARGTGQFATTHWSVVLAAGQRESPQAAAALEELCQTYWYPLYVYARRNGHGPEDAEDLIQGFFLQLFRYQSLAHVDRDKGRFRSFLLTSLKYYAADCRDKVRTQKRGSGLTALRFDIRSAEGRYSKEPCNDLSPDKVYDRQWALTQLKRVLERLAEHYRETGKVEWFAALRPFLVEGGRGKTYAEAGMELGMTEEAVKKAVLRMRQHYARLFREAIAQTLADPAQVDEELRYLHAVLTG
ncbi:MAG TPA: sigma-70 family RNA polymerase sigma factor [Candidatus Paceibacterota bacterium]|nr:sigma-70 family RNA polymerase sigma factor [Verrucomicrobiota bacterium]HRY51574.1 sigma-70 family RNA polymerase sigma factor [Candidatus Paceibacterota bacterium]HSA01133.1 sigma-70 family RNA polymerase sigma factor [Candidatus Paceibacterota bacterium]